MFAIHFFETLPVTVESLQITLYHKTMQMAAHEQMALPCSWSFSVSHLLFALFSFLYLFLPTTHHSYNGTKKSKRRKKKRKGKREKEKERKR